MRLNHTQENYQLSVYDCANPYLTSLTALVQEIGPVHFVITVYNVSFNPARRNNPRV